VGIIYDMDTNTQTQIFFMISSIGFVLLWILTAIFLFFLVKAMRSFSRMAEKLENGIDKISDTAMDIVEDVRDNLIYRFLFGSKKRRKGSKKSEE
jgi:large-conductance mechanosensitive channel